MNARNLKVFSLLTAGAILSNSSFAQFGSGLPFSLPVEASTVITIIAFVIEKHEASEQQKRIAEERARRAYARMPAKRKAALKAKKVRYIAVDTEKNEKTSPKAEKSVMVWDTESHQVAGSSVYDVKSTPPVGSTAKFDNYSAEYVGSGT